MPKKPIIKTEKPEKDYFNKGVTFYLKARLGPSTYSIPLYQCWLIKKEGAAHSGLMWGDLLPREFIEALGKKLGLEVKIED